MSIPIQEIILIPKEDISQEKAQLLKLSEYPDDQNWFEEIIFDDSLLISQISLNIFWGCIITGSYLAILSQFSKAFSLTYRKLISFFQ